MTRPADAGGRHASDPATPVSPQGSGTEQSANELSANELSANEQSANELSAAQAARTPDAAPAAGRGTLVGDRRSSTASAALGSPERRDIGLLQALSDAAREMHRSLSLPEVVRVSAERARQIVGAEESATTQAINGDWSRALTGSSVAPGFQGGRLRPPSPGRRGPASEVCRTNRPLRLAWMDRPADSADEPAEQTAVGSWLGAPLVGSDGRNLGLIQLAGKIGAAEFSPGDEALLLQVARMASVAIENARLYETALETRAQLARAAHVERVRAAELRAVIDAMGEAVLVCDATGRADFVNAAADALFSGRPVASYDDLLSRFRQTALSDADPTAGPVEVALRDDPTRWFELRVYPVPAVGRSSAEARESGGRIAVMRDVTTARQARAQREAFLGILSHELRTPITTIYAGSKVLARDETLESAARRELADDVSAEAERLFRLVEDLLVMTRIERGVLQLDVEPVLLQRVVASSVRLEQAHWPSTRLRHEADPNLPAVAGDATYVEQVVRNLLSNAAKYSPAEAEVEVRLEQGEGEVVCRVLDRGRGFQSGETEDLFDLFYRAPATAAQAAGAGIGLFVCRRLVGAMGGRIWARQRPGGGAEFAFALRRYREEP